MMNLKETLKNPPHHRTCKYDVWIKSVSDEDREAIEEALDNKDWSIEKLTNVLKAESFPVNYDMLRKHRNKSCTVCYK
jgi:hypothetical protein